MLQPNRNPKKVTAVIFDWAGTTVDFGSFAPVHAFIEVFKNKSIAVIPAEIRKYMGMLKKEQLRRICGETDVARQFQRQFGRVANERDMDEMYEAFEPMLIKVLPQYAAPIPGALEVVANLRQAGIKIGSTTGYTLPMMEVVRREAKARGYEPDAVVTPDQVAAGRPAPYMCYVNAIKMETFPMDTIVKVGDTPSDILEGVNAGVWNVGVIQGGSELGYTEAEMKSVDPVALEAESQAVREKFFVLGAHYVIDSIREVERVVAAINQRLENGECPCRRSNGGAG